MRQAEKLKIIDSVDKIVQGNTSNIVFLKSTDDSMIETLQKMSGTTHRSYTDSKTITRDMEKIVLANEGKASYTMSTREEPVIKYNDMAFINPRNSIIFRAGNSPIWNRNETILPMSWRLLKDNISHPGHEYNFMTIPTLSSARDFDVRKNQPDFEAMVNKRMGQALAVKTANEAYQSVYGYSDYEITQLDPDLLADEIMQIVNTSLNEELAGESEEYDDPTEIDPEYLHEYLDESINIAKGAEENTEVKQAIQEKGAEQAAFTRMIYAQGHLCKLSFCTVYGEVNRGLEQELVKAYLECKGDFARDHANFQVRDDGLYSADGKPFIIRQSESAALAQLNKDAKDKDKKVYMDEEQDISSFGSYTVTDEFFKWLVGWEKWTFADGAFDRVMASYCSDDN